MLDPYTDLLWIGFGVGSVLGATAAVVRSRTTPLEGKRWVVALGGVTLDELLAAWRSRAEDLWSYVPAAASDRVGAHS